MCIIFSFSFKLFDRSWHKVTMGVTHNQIILYVDCMPIQFQDDFYAPLEPRGFFDATDGYLSVAKHVQSPYTVPVKHNFAIYIFFYNKTN